jgi:hypothetical protein
MVELLETLTTEEQVVVEHSLISTRYLLLLERYLVS